VASAAVVALLVKEIKQQVERSANVTLSGLAEAKVGKSDEKEVEAVFAVIGIEKTKIKRMRRLGTISATTENRPRTIVVEFNSGDDAGKAITNRGTLKETAKYSKVYINYDVTDNERVVEYELRKKRNGMNAALPEADQNGKRYAIDKNGKNWY
jgi:hypothetical protein